MKKLLFASLALVPLFSSCDPEEPKIDISTEKALMDDKWKVIKIVQNPNVNEPSNTWYEVTNSQDPCILDNRLVFTSKNTVDLDEHYRKCSESNPQVISYSYTVQNDDQLKIFTDWTRIDETLWRGGKFEWVGKGIDQFTIDHRVTNASTPDITMSTIYTYEKTNP